MFYQSRGADFFKLGFPLNRFLPFASRYEVVVVSESCFSSLVKGPRSKASMRRVILQTQVRFQDIDEYFLIQNAHL